MRQAIKKHGKRVEAYQLGTGNPMEQQLITEGAIIDHGDGTYELFSQEAVNGSGQVAKAGDYFKVDEKDGKHFPYPNEKAWFEEHHEWISNDTYEQIPKPVEIYQLGDDESETIRQLLDSGELKMDMSDPDKTFLAHLWGADLALPMDGTVVVYGEKEDGSIDFNLVQAEEFEKTYVEVVPYANRPIIAMNLQALLFEHPLYESKKVISKRVENAGESSPIRVLALGSGYHVERFIDLCLQAGQMKDYYPAITVMSGSPEDDCSAYCEGELDPVNNPYSRKDMKWFVHISKNGIAIEKESTCEPYGSIDFKQIPHTMDEISTAYDYIFISLGNDQLNYKTGCILAARQSVGDPIFYVCESKQNDESRQTVNCLFPVYVNQEVSSGTIDPQLEKMAFNADLTWNTSKNLNIGNEFNAFKGDPYRLESSMEFAVSLKYKLFSVGIFIKGEHEISEELADHYLIAKDWSEAADLFATEILEKMDKGDQAAREKFDALMWLEHKRWILSQIANGWSAVRDADGNMILNESADLSAGTAKNKSQKTHACLVPSESKNMLKDYTQDQWDNMDDMYSDLDNLDDLDRMSIELHRALMQYPNETQIKAMSQEWNELLPAEDSVSEDEKSVLYSRAIGHIENLLANENNEQINRAFGQFESCLENIYSAAIQDPGQFRHYLNRFEEALTDTASGDIDLINQILAQIEKNFSPIIEKNQYRNYKETDEDLTKKIPFILTYSRLHGLVMAFEDGRTQNGKNDAVFTNVASATVLCPEEICYLYCFDQDSDIDLLLEKLAAVFDYIKYRELGVGVILKVAYVGDESDSDYRRLKKGLDKLKSETQWLQFCYEPYVFQELGLALKKLSEEAEDKKLSGFIYDGSTDISSSFSVNGEFFDLIYNTKIPYMEFDWRHKKFTKHVGCDYLQYMDDDSYIRIEDMFILMGAKETQLLPQNFKNEYEIMWGIYTGNYLHKKNQGDKFKTGVVAWNKLCGLLEDYQKNHTHNGLTVTALDITKKSVNNLLHVLEEAKCIKNLFFPHAEQGKCIVNFQYSSPRVMEILTKAGKILELYIYYQALKTGYFDDIVTGYEFEWKEGKVKNELDLVLTKGFQTIIIECKATKELDAEYYYKLYSVAELFGVGSIKLLIWTDHTAQGRPEKYNEKNVRQRKRGNQMGIIMRYGQETIYDIGNELKELINRN